MTAQVIKNNFGSKKKAAAKKASEIAKKTQEEAIKLHEDVQEFVGTKTDSTQKTLAAENWNFSSLGNTACEWGNYGLGKVSDGAKFTGGKAKDFGSFVVDSFCDFAPNTCEKASTWWHGVDSDPNVSA